MTTAADLEAARFVERLGQAGRHAPRAAFPEGVEARDWAAILLTRVARLLEEDGVERADVLRALDALADGAPTVRVRRPT